MGRYALLIGNSEYDDERLARLKAPPADVRALAELLRDPEIGRFDGVQECLNPSFMDARSAIVEFFTAKKPDDLLLLYFSGHGVLDWNNALYLAVKNTQYQRPRAAGIESTFIKNEMSACRAKQQVLLLDCCFSGAFSEGLKSVGVGAQAVQQDTFVSAGRGQVILTASDSTQYAWEGDRVLGTAQNSLFTHFVVEGLKSGAADCDGDGVVTPEDMYSYVYEQIVTATPNQKPQYAGSHQGEMALAYHPYPLAAHLPLELLKACKPGQTLYARIGAVRELGRLLRHEDAAVVAAARAQLEVMAKDDSRGVSDEAQRVLAEEQAHLEAERKRQEQAERQRQRRQELARQRLEEEARKQREANEQARLKQESEQKAAAEAAEQTRLEEAARKQKEAEAQAHLKREAERKAAAEFAEHQRLDEEARKKLAAEAAKRQAQVIVQPRPDRSSKVFTWPRIRTDLSGLLRRYGLLAVSGPILLFGVGIVVIVVVASLLGGDGGRNGIATQTAAAASTQTEAAIAALFPTGTLTLEPNVTPAPAATATPSPPTQPTSITPTPTPQTTATRTLIPTETPYPQKITDAKGVPMALIPAGSFQMGSESRKNDEKSVHSVTLDAFYMDVYEVTYAFYQECMTAGNCEPPQTGVTTPTPLAIFVSRADYPIAFISWFGAKSYCEWRGARLPTEAEWEKAARGGLEGKLYPWGSDIPVCTPGAVNGVNSGSCSLMDTMKVGNFAPNGYGLYDMAGNVSEWVNDWYSGTYYQNSPAKNPTGPEIGEYRILRGGSWLEVWSAHSVSNRFSDDPYRRRGNYGFRCARLLDTQFPTKVSTPMPEPLTTATPTLTAAITPYPSEITDTKGIPMALIPAGAFQMGSNITGTQGIYTITLNAYYIDVYEVTNTRYAECVKVNKCNPPSKIISDTRSGYYDDPQYANYPVIYVSWVDGLNYCNWRNARLPTEAEWEKAARGGLNGKNYPWGNDAPTCKIGATNGVNYDHCTGDTVEVGSFSPNGYGLYDMAGNVIEWVSSLLVDYPYNATDGREDLAAGGRRVLRGGSWDDTTIGIASRWGQFRYPNSDGIIGFRCAYSP